MEIIEAAGIIGIAVRIIEDHGEVGYSPVNFESAKNYPLVWMRQSESWMKRYKMDIGEISQAVSIYADAIKSCDARTIDQAKGRMFISYLASPDKA